MSSSPSTATKPRPIEIFKNTLNMPSVQEQFKNALAKNAPLFIASLIDLYGNDDYLQKCDPKAVIMEALKAATVKLPLNKSLGFAWIVPYGNKPRFQIGWKGFVQLAIRTGQYKTINADIIYEGQMIHLNRVTGNITINEEPKTTVALGYFAYIELINGFSKAMFWPKEKVRAHAQRYSKSYHKQDSAWQTEFDAMALKTVLSALLRKYGIMSIEMAGIFSQIDQDEQTSGFEEEVNEEANADIIDLKTGEILNETSPEKSEQSLDGIDKE